MAMIKKKMQMGGKAKLVAKGKPMGGEIGAYNKLKGADLELEKANYKKFGDAAGSGPSGAMPKPKKKMGGTVKKADKGGSFGALSVKAGVDNNYGITAADRISGAKMNKGEAKSGAALKKQAATAIAMKKAGVKPKGMKSGGSMKKCKYGCK